MTSDVQVLPDGLATSDLLTSLSAQGLVDALVESLYGDAESTERANRAMDERILSAVCGALGADLSTARLSAALRLLMGEPNPSDLLSAEEQQIVADELFSEQYRQQAHSHLRRMESFLHPLERLGDAAAPRPVANLTCLLSVSDGRNARNELLNDLIVQWLVRRMSTSAELPRTLVVSGADELQRRQLEKLSDVCEQRHVRLVLMFRHLRDASLQVLGGGAVAFMRLGNHAEATRAADFVGRHHTFVLSQLTRTLGGNETHTNTEGDTVSDGISGDWGLLFRRAQQWNHGRSWSQTNSYAAGTNWSDAMSQHRVYEYAVEPRTLQDLPDYAMLLVESRAGGPVRRAVECNPSIVTLPRVSMDELPHLPLPAHPEVPGRLPVQQIATSGFAQPTNRGVPVSPQGYPGMRPPPGAPQVGRMPGAGQWRGPGPGPRT